MTDTFTLYKHNLLFFYNELFLKPKSLLHALISFIYVLNFRKEISKQEINKEVVKGVQEH